MPYFATYFAKATKVEKASKGEQFATLHERKSQERNAQSVRGSIVSNEP